MGAHCMGEGLAYRPEGIHDQFERLMSWGGRRGCPQPSPLLAWTQPLELKIDLPHLDLATHPACSTLDFVVVSSMPECMHVQGGQVKGDYE